MFQACNLIPTLTVLENLLVPLQLNEVARAVARERCDALLESAGLARYPHRFPEELSGGEQQRVAVLRAIAHEPAVVIADEPTGNLDLGTAREVLDLLERFCGEEGRTLVMATHSREVMGRARRVLRVVDGQLRRPISGPRGPADGLLLLSGLRFYAPHPGQLCSPSSASHGRRGGAGDRPCGPQFAAGVRSFHTEATRNGYPRTQSTGRGESRFRCSPNCAGS